MATGSLLEREEALRTLGALVDDASRLGLGAVAVVEGAPGLGKTALLDEIAIRAAAAGLRVMRARGAEREGALRNGVVRQLFAPLELQLAADPAGVLHELYSQCASLATGVGAALVIDDAQWADAASLGWVAYLARRVTELPALVVLAYTPGEDAAARRPLTTIAASRETLVRTLQPLSARGTARLVRATAGTDVPDEICEACHTASGGNPFYVRELVLAGGESLGSVGAPIEAMAPESVSRAVVGRLVRLDAGAVRLGGAVAVLGERVPARYVFALADLDAERGAAAADALAEATILADRRPLAFVHPIIRAAIYAELADATRGALHLRAARLLSADGDDPAAVAVQLLAAEPHGDPWVVDRLREAAAVARRGGDPCVAARCLARALAEPCAAVDRGDVLFELGAVEARVLAPAAVPHLLEAFDLAEEPARRAEIALVLLPVLSLMPGTLDVGLDVAARAGAGPALAATRAALLDMQLAPAEADGSGGLLRALLRGRSAVEVSSLLDAGAGDDLSRAAAAAACERPDVAEPALAAALARAGRHGSALEAGYALCLRSELQLRRGKVAGAEADARQALEELEGFDAFTPSALLADALLERGEVAEASAVLGDGRALPETLPTLAVLPRRIRARVAAGDLDGALADLAECERLVARAGLGAAVALEWRPAGALARHAAGDLVRARSLADEHLRLARAFGAPGVLGAALRVAGVVHGGRRGLAMLETAAAHLEGGDLPVEQARALLALGIAQRDNGARVEARATLARALDLGDGCGALAIAGEARAALVTAGARPRRNRLRGREALTASELRIATLAADGLTNCQIGQSLYVTPKTVERHLTRVYAKLDVAKRCEVAGALSAAA